jgi:hypothetical protein
MLGYDDGHGYVTIQISGSNPLSDLIDLSLGLRKSLKIDASSWHDVRFGIDRALPSPEEAAELSVSSTVLKGTLCFREHKASPGIKFATDVYNPSVNFVVPPERVKFRLRTRLFEMLIEPFKGIAQLRFLPDAVDTDVDLFTLRSFLRLLQMLSLQALAGYG